VISICPRQVPKYWETVTGPTHCLKNNPKCLLFSNSLKSQRTWFNKNLKSLSYVSFNNICASWSPHIGNCPSNIYRVHPSICYCDRRIVEIFNVVGLWAIVRDAAKVSEKILAVIMSAYEVQLIPCSHIINKSRVHCKVRLNMSRAIFKRTCYLIKCVSNR